MKHVVQRTIFNKKIVSILILAAGCGERIKGYGTRSLLPVDGTTLINYQTDRLDAIFINNETTVVVGFESGKVITNHHGSVRFVENQLYESTGSAYSLRLALNSCLGDSVLIIHGDLWFTDMIFRDIITDKSCAILSDKMNPDEIGCVVCDGEICNFAYGLDTKWAQIVFLTGLELKLARQWVNSVDCSNKFTFECLNHILSNKGKIKSIISTAPIVEIDNPKEDLYAIANTIK